MRHFRHSLPSPGISDFRFFTRRSKSYDVTDSNPTLAHSGLTGGAATFPSTDAQVGNVRPFKVWLALTLTLLYVVMRYHHSDETRKERAYVAEQFRELRRVAIIHRIESAVRRYFLQGVPVSLFDDSVEFLDGDIEKHMARDGRASEVDDLQIGTADPTAGQPWWQGRVGVQFHAIWPGGAYGRYGGNQPAYTLPRADRIWVSAVGTLRAATASRAGVDIGLPYTTAALAALTSLYKGAYFFPL